MIYLSVRVISHMTYVAYTHFTALTQTTGGTSATPANLCYGFARIYS